MLDVGAFSFQPRRLWRVICVSASINDPSDIIAKFLTDIAQNIREKFPNCRIVFLSTRTHAYTITKPQSPEPYAYETGFANKWTIEAQIDGDPDLCFKDPNDPNSCPDGVKAA